MEEKEEPIELYINTLIHCAWNSMEETRSLKKLNCYETFTLTVAKSHERRSSHTSTQVQGAELCYRYHWKQAEQFANFHIVWSQILSIDWKIFVF